MKKNWLDIVISFYDFIWKTGVCAHSECINNELLESYRQDIEAGKDKFQEMKRLILKKFPTIFHAIQEFIESEKNSYDKN